MLNNIVSLTKKLISIRSVPTDTKSLESILKLASSNLKGYTVEHFKNKGVGSILAYKARKRPARFKIILNGHLDIIPGKESQYLPRIKGNRLYGAGSMDMKANVACLIMAFKEVADKVDYPLGLQLVTDEEIGGFNGTKYQVEKGIRADLVIAGEPTNFDIVHEAKGVLWVNISARGKAAHGAYPWRGENAIWKMAKLLDVLRKKYPVPKKEAWVTTLNLSQIKTTNASFNKIPDDCMVGLDIRYIAEDSSTIIRDLRRLLPRGFVLEVVAKEPALYTDKNNEHLKMLQASAARIIGNKIRLRGAQGTSDARHFARVGCAGVEFGPVGGGIGSDNEWVDIPSLGEYYQILKDFLLSLDVAKNKEHPDF